MAHLINVAINTGEKALKGAYLYAVATLPEFRGRGIAADIIKFAENHCKEAKYDFLCLIPQKESHFAFYERFGFKKYLYGSKAEFDDLQVDTNGLNVVLSKDYTNALKIYNSLPCLKLSRTEEDLISIQRVYNTDFYYLTGGEEPLAYCIGEKYNDVFEVYEAVGNEQNIKILTTIIAKQTCCSAVTIVSTPHTFSDTVIGSVKPISKQAAKLFETEKVYANLLFN